MTEMRTKINNWLFKIAFSIIAKRLVFSNNHLTPNYLIKKGWVETESGYTEPIIKNRDRITISFENHYYRVWHSDKRTFIALESTIEWFETYYLLAHPDNGRYKIAKI